MSCHHHLLEDEISLVKVLWMFNVYARFGELRKLYNIKLNLWWTLRWDLRSKDIKYKQHLISTLSFYLNSFKCVLCTSSKTGIHVFIYSVRLVHCIGIFTSWNENKSVLCLWYNHSLRWSLYITCWGYFTWENLYSRDGQYLSI